MKGYIKDFRKELQSDVWLMPPLYHRVWQFLKYKVNHKDAKVPMRDGTFLTIKQGQHLTSLRKIANQVGYYEQGAWKEPNPKTIKSILTWLEKQNMISVERGNGNGQYTLITLLNWEIYQEENEEGNSNYTPSAHQVDTNNNDIRMIKNDKEYKRHKYEICDMNLAELLFSKIKENNPSHKEPNLEKWANDFRLMRERDKRTEEQIRYLINWSQEHHFWHTNILSPAKLRKQFDKLVMQVKSEKVNKQSKVVPIKQDDDKRDYGF